MKPKLSNGLYRLKVKLSGWKDGQFFLLSEDDIFTVEKDDYSAYDDAGGLTPCWWSGCDEGFGLERIA